MAKSSQRALVFPCPRSMNVKIASLLRPAFIASVVSVVETSDYYPYGSMRMNVRNSGVTQEQRKFIGEQQDVDSGLSFLNARYYQNTLGRYLAQDPLAINIAGNTQQYGRDQTSVLINPQELNTYSYALNNPINKSDPSGLNPLIRIGMAAWNIGARVTQWAGTQFGQQVIMGGAEGALTQGLVDSATGQASSPSNYTLAVAFGAATRVVTPPKAGLLTTVGIAGGMAVTEGVAKENISSTESVAAIGSSGYTYTFQNGLPNLTAKQNALLVAGGSIVDAGLTMSLNSNSAYQARLDSAQAQINSLRNDLQEIRAQSNNGAVMYTNGNHELPPLNKANK